MPKITRIFLVLTLLSGLQTAKALPINWNGWNFDYEVSGNFNGLTLNNVSYQGVTLIKKINLPVMRVFYNNNICGPYADLLGGTLSTIPWAGNQTIAQRQFTLDSKQWYEIGIRDQIGNYDIYQVYYLSSDGILDAHIYSKGLQCVIDHIHYPNWRIDFDVDGPANDIIEHMVGSTYQIDQSEFNAGAGNAVNHNWRVRDTASNIYIDMLPGFPGFTVPDGSTTIPVTDYSQNTVFGRLYRATEDATWTYGPNTQVPFGNSENINGTDLVAWYEGYMPHAASGGSALWHSTGVRLVSSLATATNPPQPDVVVQSLTYSNGIFTSVIKNQGTQATPSGVTVGVSYFVDGSYKTYGTTRNLAAGATATVGTSFAHYIPNGTHTIMAFVDDNNRFAESNESNNTLSQSITVTGANDTTPPTVSITSPADGTTLPRSTVALTASATDTSGIASVQFKIDGANVGSKDTTAPFSVNWSTTNVADGAHVLTALAQDTLGNTATSSNVVININNGVLTALPDVVVTNLAYSNGVFSCTVKNQGTTATPNGISIGVSYLVDGRYKTYGSLYTPLAAGASANIGLTGPAFVIPSGTHTIGALADDNNRFAESDENNNILSQSIVVP